MINYFLNQQEGITASKRKIIKKQFLTHRKYNPFHLDCQFSKKKLCYCKTNPIQGINASQRQELWKQSYQKAYQFYQTKRQEKSQELSQKNPQLNPIQQKMSQTIHSEQQQYQAKVLFVNSVKKIRTLSKEELVNYIRQNQSKSRNMINDYDLPVSTQHF